MITIGVIFKGDVPAGQKWVGYAKSQLAILKRQMSFQKLREGVREVSPMPGVIVQCYSNKSTLGNFSYDEVLVYVTGGKARAEAWIEEKFVDLECYCFPHISLGKVLAVYPTILPVPDPSDYDTTAEYNAAVEEYEASVDVYNAHIVSDSCFTYDIEVCSDTMYVLFEGVHDPNFGRYYVDQSVLVGVGYHIDGEEDRVDPFPNLTGYPCDRQCLITDPKFPNIIIMPIHIVNDEGEPLMDKWWREEERIVRRQA